MEIVLAKSAGFCFGVNRAIEAVYAEAGKGESLYLRTYYTQQKVTADLEEKGV